MGYGKRSAFSALVAPGELLSLRFETELRHNTMNAGDGVRFLLKSGGEPPTNLPELAFDMQFLETPAPPIMSLTGMALLVSTG